MERARTCEASWFGVQEYELRRDRLLVLTET